MKLFMEAPNIILKLPMILFWIFGKLNLVSKIEIKLSQFWVLKFISYLAIFRFCELVTEMSTWNFLNNLEVQEWFVFQVKQLHWFGCLESLLPHFNCLHMLIVRSSNSISMTWCKTWETKSGKILRIFQYKAGAVTNLPPYRNLVPRF